MTAFPRTTVMGAGAIGCYFGGVLARAGAGVTLIGRSALADAVRRNGLIFESGGKTETIRLEATTQADGVRDAKLVLICVKSADTETATAAIVPHLGPDTTLLSLQNGVGNVERIRAATGRPVIAGLVYIGTTMAAPGHVRHTGGDRIAIGAVRGCGVNQTMLAEVVELFRIAGVTVDVPADIEAVMWSKLMLNCAYNAVCALTGKPYGEMGAAPEIRAIMQAAAEETIALARRKGVAVGNDVFDGLFAMTQSMPRQMSSTAQDIARGRPTEIDYLNGFVARESEALGLVAPVNRMLNALVKLREKKPA